MARRTMGRHGRAVGLALWVLSAATMGACARRTPTLANLPTVTIGRQDIVVTVEATGTVEPINLVEVKSKASGLIVKLPVQVGSVVHRGDLLAQIDPHDVKAEYDQAAAALASAEAKREIAKAQRKRADDLFAAQAMAAVDHETAILADASAEADLVQARTSVDLARQRLEDATVRAPIDGTVLSEAVAVGQVISSATSSVSGGTTLLDMADLSRIRVRSFVSETDIGRVRAGQPATVAIDAYPRRPFHGLVDKIEPQAVVQQSITMFPVLVSLSNEEGLLLPGMNGEVTVLVDQRNDVVAVPLDGVRTPRELIALAPVLGLDPDSLRALGAASTGAARFGSDPARGAAWTGGGRRGAAGGDSSFTRRRSRGFGADSTRARRGMGGFGRDSATVAGGGRGGGGSGGAQLAVVKTASGLRPRVVRLGLSNYDDAQVIDGLAEGDQIVMLSVVELQQQRTQSMDRMRQRTGALPGLGGGGGGGQGGGGRATGR